MSSEITLKQGPGIPKKAGSTILSPGEPGWSTDLRQLYVGTADPQAPHRIAGGSDSFVNVKDFGAKGDGLADDTAAFKSACSSAVAGSVHKSVYIPTGDYKVGNVITAATIQLTMFGDHRDLSQIHCTPTVTTFDASVDARIAMSAMRVNTTAAATKPFIRTGTGQLCWITMADCTMDAAMNSNGTVMISGPHGNTTSNGLIICTRTVFTGGAIAMDANLGTIRLFMHLCTINNSGWNNFLRVQMTDCALNMAGTLPLCNGNSGVIITSAYFLTSRPKYVVTGSSSVSIKGSYFSRSIATLFGHDTDTSNSSICIEDVQMLNPLPPAYKLVHCPTAPRNLNVNVDMPSTAIDSPTATVKDYRNMSDGIWFGGNKITP